MLEPSWETSANWIPLSSPKGSLVAEHINQGKSKFLYPRHCLSLCQVQGQPSFPMSRNLKEICSLERLWCFILFRFKLYTNIVLPPSPPHPPHPRKEERKRENVPWQGKIDAKIESESDDLAQIPYLVFFTTGSKMDNCFKTLLAFL